MFDTQLTSQPRNTSRHKRRKDRYMQIQFSTTENCSSPLLPNGLNFEGVPPADPPDNTGGGTGANEPEEEEEPLPEGN